MVQDTGSVVVTVGSMVASSSLLSQLVIFNDPAYWLLAGVGAMASTLGVIYELAHTEKDWSKLTVCAEICRGMFLGIFAVPMWFLMLTAIGDALIIHILGIPSNNVAKIDSSVWFMLSLILSWKTVGIYDFLVEKVRKVFKCCQ